MENMWKRTKELFEEKFSNSLMKNTYNIDKDAVSLLGNHF